MKRQWILVTIILILAALLTYVAEDFMDRAIVTPMLYVVWVVRLLFSAIPQEIIWAIFLVVALIITWRRVFTRRRRPKKSGLPSRERLGRIATWHKLIRQAEQESYYRWQLAQRLRKLTLGALAHAEQSSRREIRRRLKQNELDLPPDIQTYLQASTISFGHFTTGKRRLFRAKPNPSPLDLAPEKIANFLEKRFDL